jgi:hypothetical protein
VKTTIVAFAAVCLAAMGSVERASAVVIGVDQQYTATQNSLAITAGNGIGQTFTVGVTGQLIGMDLELGRQAAVTQPLEVELRTMTGSLPDVSAQGLLYSTSVSASTVPVQDYPTTFTLSLDLSSAALHVTPGEQLALLLTTTDNAWYNWAADDSSTHPYQGGGSLQLGYPFFTWVNVPGNENGFETLVAVVPEPSALLPLAALVPLVWRRWKES